MRDNERKKHTHFLDFFLEVFVGAGVIRAIIASLAFLLYSMSFIRACCVATLSVGMGGGAPSDFIAILAVALAFF